LQSGCNMRAMAQSLQESRRRTAENLRQQVEAATRDPHNGEMTALVAIADGKALRGVPAVSKHSSSSAIHGTQPGFGLFDDDE
jgi:hypothetical protein